MSNLSLNQCRQNQTCQVVALHGPLDTKLQLVNLGFHTHSHIKVILTRSDCLVLNIDGSRFALDRQLAQQIEVQLLS
ncbi:MAG: FeoA family protein [Thiomicrospira sp.]